MTKDIDNLISYGFSKYHLFYGVKKFSNIKVLNELAEFVKGYSTDSTKIVSNFLDKNRKYNLFIYSTSNGTGKTTLLHFLALYFYKERKNLHYPSFLFDQISAFFKRARNNIQDSEQNDILQEMCEVDFLFVDDLDKAGALTDFEMENFRLIVDTRYRNLKSIFITANKSFDSLLNEKIIDQAMYSRLIETCLVLNLDDVDYRLLKPAKKKSKLVLPRRKELVLDKFK